MNIAYRKVWRDLWNNKGRTLLVVVSITVGVLAVGMITSSNELLTRQMSSAQIESHPSHAKIYLSKPIDEDTVRNLARMPEISQIEGWMEASLLWKPTKDAEWEQSRALLVALVDYENQNFDLLTILSGWWPETEADTAAVEFNHIEPFNIPAIGEKIYFEVNERTRSMNIGGIVRDPAQFPPPMVQAPTFYVTTNQIEQLTNMSGFTSLRITIPKYSESQAEITVDLIEKKLDNIDVSITYFEVQDPERHPLQDIINGVGIVLGVMAIMALGLSTFLVVNTMNAIIAQQVPQIGAMKTIGGVKRQIVMLYLTGVGAYSLLSLILAVPLGAWGGQTVTKWMLYLLNVPSTEFEILWNSLLYQVGAGLVAPMLAGLYPVLRGSTVTVREAISSYGLGGGYGTGLVDRFLSRIRGLPMLVMLPMRNAFRNVGRLALTEITLIVAGGIFMTVLSTGYSFTNTLTSIWEGFGFDILITFEKSQHIVEVLPMIESRPYVEHAEMWVWHNAKARSPEAKGLADEYKIALRGIPRNSVLLSPQLTDGRNLDPTDGHAMLLNQNLAQEMNLGVGDQIVLDLGEVGESTWTIIGLIFDLTAGQKTAYMPIDTLNAELHQIGKATVAEIKIKDKEASLEDQLVLLMELQDFLEGRGLSPGFGTSAIQQREQATGQLNILTTLLLVMTLLIAIVGGVGLSGTQSLSVIERSREIGVMRAIGSSSFDVAIIFMGEGLMIGLFSWVLAIPFSMWAVGFFVEAIASAVDFPAISSYSLTGAWIWLGIVSVLSLLASWLPARHATRISVAESLAYE
jgi:putative ABC transport system permease protein